MSKKDRQYNVQTRRRDNQKCMSKKDRQYNVQTRRRTDNTMFKQEEGQTI
jgi:hypothetical protein